MDDTAGRYQQGGDHTPDQPRAEISPDGLQTRADAESAQMDRRHKIVAQKAQKKAMDALALLDPEAMTATEARQLLKTAQEIERRITAERRDPDRQREDVQSLLAGAWAAAQKK